MTRSFLSFILCFVSLPAFAEEPATGRKVTVEIPASAAGSPAPVVNVMPAVPADVAAAQAEQIRAEIEAGKALNAAEIAKLEAEATAALAKDNPLMQAQVALAYETKSAPDRVVTDTVNKNRRSVFGGALSYSTPAGSDVEVVDRQSGRKKLEVVTAALAVDGAQDNERLEIMGRILNTSTALEEDRTFKCEGDACATGEAALDLYGHGASLGYRTVAYGTAGTRAVLEGTRDNSELEFERKPTELTVVEQTVVMPVSSPELTKEQKLQLIEQRAREAAER